MCSTRVCIVIAPSSARGSVCGAVEHPFANLKGTVPEDGFGFC